MERFKHIHDINIHFSCRTCLENLNYSHFDVFTTPDLKKKLSVCTSMSIEPDDGFPTSLCDSCYKKIDEFYNFKLMSISAMKYFQDYVYSEKTACTLELTAGDGDDNGDADADESNLKTEIKNLEVMMLKEVKKEVEDEEEDSINLDDEGLESDQNESSQEFDETKSDDEKTKETSETSGDSNSNNSSNIRLYAKEGFKDNLQKRKDGEHRCAYCSRFFYSAQGRNNHEEIHDVKKKLECNLCFQNFKEIDELRNHRYVHNTQQLPYECLQCQKRFSSTLRLRDHTNRHLGIKKHVCTQCGAAKTTRAELAIHINFHTKEKAFPCEFCDKVFYSSGNIGRHKRIVHQAIRNFKCAYCDKAFGTGHTRKYHEMSHTGERPHECNICHKTFTKPYGLKKHKMTHKNNKEKS